MTPENSEAPREAVGELGLLERYDALRERAEDRAEYDPVALRAIENFASGLQQALDEDAAAAAAAAAAATKVSSPELASLAAKYLDFDEDAFIEQLASEGHTTWNSVRQLIVDAKRLAASVLAQAEGTPRK